MTMRVRPAAAAELPSLAALVSGQPLLERYGSTAERLARDLAAALADGQSVLAAEEDGRALGFAWFLLSGTFALGGYLRLIALAPGEEGRGAGSALLDEVEQQVAAHSRSLFLLVSSWNAPARRFYEKRGYVEVGLLPGFVRADADEVIAWKRLR